MPIRVGDAGVAVGARAQLSPERIAWYEVESVGLEDNKIVVKARGASEIVASLDPSRRRRCPGS